jgi:hypothetical protein
MNVNAAFFLSTVYNMHHCNFDTYAEQQLFCAFGAIMKFEACRVQRSLTSIEMRWRKNKLHVHVHRDRYLDRYLYIQVLLIAVQQSSSI